MAMAAPTAGELITNTVLDYYEGWHDADIARMDRALHSDLVKRSSRDSTEPCSVS